jgi:hypothetical protein
VTDVRHVLVFPDRDTAEEAAELLAASHPLAEEPRLVRDALAGEDDADDAQWLVILENPPASLSRKALEGIAAAREGWLES